jgi:hypothetical protein
MQKQQDEALLEAFHLMNADEQQFFLEMAQVHTEGRISKKPVLTLVLCSSTAPVGNSLSRGLG